MLASYYIIVFKTVEELNKYFLDHSYCVGFAPSNRDAELFVIVHRYMDAEKYPHLARWFTHMCSFNNKAYAFLMPLNYSEFPVVEEEFKFEVPEAKKEAQPKKEEEEEEEEDLFGDDDDDEDDEAAEAMQEKLRAEAEKKKKEANKKVEKSLLVIHIKPFDEETDLKALFEKIRTTQVKGCKWGETCAIKPLAFGINFLEISCVIEDDVCSEDDVIDAIMQFEDEVQSTEIVSFNKISYS